MNLQHVINVAAQYMPRDRAEELTRNIVQIFILDGESMSQLVKFEQVLGAINHRRKNFGLVVMCPGDAAGAIVRACDHSEVAA